MPNIVIFFKRPLPMDPPFSDPDYFRAYQELNQEVSDAGGSLYFARSQTTYAGAGQFTNSWQIHQDGLIETGPITAQVIFNKGQAAFDSTVPVFNHPSVGAICTDKWRMYELFGQYCPTTILAHSSTEAVTALQQCRTEKVVLKPQTGAEGRDIRIADKADLLAELSQIEYPVIVQEFLDTSVGVPGLHQGIHDFRLALIDGEVMYAEVRTPPPGSLQANVARGGSFTIFKPEQAPQEALAIAEQIDAHMQQFGHRFYSIDFGFTAQGPRIIEMNSEVGLLPNSDGAVFQNIKHKLAQILVELAN